MAHDGNLSSTGPSSEEEESSDDEKEGGTLPKPGALIKSGRLFGTVLDSTRVRWEHCSGEPVESVRLVGKGGPTLILPRPPLPRSGRLIRSSHPPEPTHAAGALRWSPAKASEIEEGMAVRSGLAAVELHSGKPLPPVEQLQLEKMHLVGFLPHAEELPGAKIAQGLGCAPLLPSALGPPHTTPGGRGQNIPGVHIHTHHHTTPCFSAGRGRTRCTATPSPTASASSR